MPTDQVSSENALREKEDFLVVEELSKIGLNIGSVYDLAKISLSKEAVPILLSMMRSTTHPAIKQGIIRALGDRDNSRDIGPELLSYFKDIDENEWAREDTKWVLGNSIEIIAGPELLDDMIEIALDDSHGKSREMIVLGLGKIRDERAFLALKNLVNDPQVEGHAVSALGKLGDRRAIPLLESKTSSGKSWVRREAKSALNRLRKIQ
ncbi:MAG TPA: HEAT repeat domain-containing protein [Phenylobacterium sp.]|jgi:HEAT repeat protein|uniref:HEAT repeat domain-containing protein n=1 Tax=Phenylobacterium sp. TaxID=1871053 RepID=UPI002BDC99A9|nr:HEAT repeat domain-containing protein [Phenylobacterium sp.]HXA40258.1 HEAT repeat domain-containing protein [Phenylobacterium sp.]